MRQKIEVLASCLEETRTEEPSAGHHRPCSAACWWQHRAEGPVYWETGQYGAAVGKLLHAMYFLTFQRTITGILFITTLLEENNSMLELCLKLLVVLGVFV